MEIGAESELETRQTQMQNHCGEFQGKSCYKTKTPGRVQGQLIKPVDTYLHTRTTHTHVIFIDPVSQSLCYISCCWHQTYRAIHYWDERLFSQQVNHINSKFNSVIEGLVDKMLICNLLRYKTCCMWLISNTGKAWGKMYFQNNSRTAKLKSTGGLMSWM